MQNSYQFATVHIRGLTPSMMNNGQKTNPLNKYAMAMHKIIKSKPRGQNLTEEQQIELMRLDHEGGLYVNGKGRVAWPAENIEAMLISAAKQTRQGPKAKAGLTVTEVKPLVYEGPQDPGKLFDSEQHRDTRTARVQGRPCLRCRSFFPKWECEFTVMFLSDQIDIDTLRGWLQTAGILVGLSDYRPRYGKFELVKCELVEK